VNPYFYRHSSDRFSRHSFTSTLKLAEKWLCQNYSPLASLIFFPWSCVILLFKQYIIEVCIRDRVVDVNLEVAGLAPALGSLLDEVFFL
jgi:hypothetical protein